MGDDHTWWIYILNSTQAKYKNHTYVGMTCNADRRLMQHNGELPGGAKYTSSKGPWQFLLHMSGFPDRCSALQAEWSIKEACRANYKFYGPVGRVRSLVWCLSTQERWTSKYKGLIKEEQYRISVQPKFEHLLEDIERWKTITIVKLNDEDFVDHYTNDIGKVVSESTNNLSQNS